MTDILKWRVSVGVIPNRGSPGPGLLQSIHLTLNINSILRAKTNNLYDEFVLTARGRVGVSVGVKGGSCLKNSLKWIIMRQCDKYRAVEPLR